MLKEVINDSHESNKVTFDFSSYQLSDVEKSLLCKGLNFSDVKQETLCNENFSLMKARILDTTLSSYESFSLDRSPSGNLKASEFKALSKKPFV